MIIWVKCRMIFFQSVHTITTKQIGREPGPPFRMFFVTVPFFTIISCYLGPPRVDNDHTLLSPVWPQRPKNSLLGKASGKCLEILSMVKFTPNITQKPKKCLSAWQIVIKSDHFQAFHYHCLKCKWKTFQIYSLSLHHHQSLLKYIYVRTCLFLP